MLTEVFLSFFFFYLFPHASTSLNMGVPLVFPGVGVEVWGGPVGRVGGGLSLLCFLCHGTWSCQLLSLYNIAHMPRTSKALSPVFPPEPNYCFWNWGRLRTNYFILRRL